MTNMDQYFKIVGLIELEIEKCIENEKLASEKKDFVTAHQNIYVAEILRGILDKVEPKHYR